MQLGDNESSPDETSLCKFRAWMTKNNKQEKLFQIVNCYLNDKGCFVKKGSLVDATIIDAPKNKSNSEKKWMDEDASSTKKGSTWYRGYKAHMATDFGSNLITDIMTTTAKVADTKVFDLLIPDDIKAVLADKGYYSKERKAELRSRGIFCDILDKAARGKKLSNSQTKRNKKLSSAKAYVEHPFNAIKNWFGFKKTRFVGIVKNTAQMFMMATLYNLHKIRKTLDPEPVMS